MDQSFDPKDKPSTPDGTVEGPAADNAQSESETQTQGEDNKTGTGGVGDGNEGDAKVGGNATKD